MIFDRNKDTKKVKPIKVAEVQVVEGNNTEVAGDEVVKDVVKNRTPMEAEDHVYKVVDLATELMIRQPRVTA